MGKEITVMEWNIKGSANTGWDEKSPGEFARKTKGVVQEIEELSQMPDILVLVEFVIIPGMDCLFSFLQENGYIWFQTAKTGKNGILLAIKRKLLAVQQVKANLYNSGFWEPEDTGTNFLAVTLPLAGGGNLTIIGFRMEVTIDNNMEKIDNNMENNKGKNWEAEYNRMGKEFQDIYLPLIDGKGKDMPCIICGDFNNGACRAPLDGTPHAEAYKIYAQKKYNLNIIQSVFTERGIQYAGCPAGWAICEDLPNIRYPNRPYFCSWV